MNNQLLSFDDVLIEPNFSFVKSRKDVTTEFYFLDLTLSLGVISANMDTVTGPAMAATMNLNGAKGCLHRFSSIDENVKEFYKTIDITRNNKAYQQYHSTKPFVSIGVGKQELDRAYALMSAGATHFVIDVAHGAAQHVVEQYDKLNMMLPEGTHIIVGNFATARTIKDFEYHVTTKTKPSAYKVGIGGGSMCTTRRVTGAGYPTFASILDCVSVGKPIIADGGIRNSGDFAKCLAAGASMVMCGQLLAGTDESPGKVIWWKDEMGYEVKPGYKNYRGSASKGSYEIQGKVSNHRTPEGESTVVEYKGPVKNILQDLEAGLRSAMSYVGAVNLTEFREKAKFNTITNAGLIESLPHGKRS